MLRNKQLELFSIHIEHNILISDILRSKYSNLNIQIYI